VLHNKTSTETENCSVPPHFFPIAFNGIELIGKNSGTEGDIQLEKLELKPPG